MDTNTTAAKDAATKPVQVFRRDALSVSIFANEATRDGKPVVFHKVTISKTYKKKDDEGFARTSSFEARANGITFSRCTNRCSRISWTRPKTVENTSSGASA